jgi:hypothetical protein
MSQPEGSAADLKRALREIVAAGTGEEHPAPEELLAYAARALPPAAAERVREHLTLCEECLGLFLDIGSLTPEAPGDAAAAGETAAAWEQLATVLASEPASRPEAAAERPAVLSFRPRIGAPPRALYALAASLLLAVVGLGFWVGSLRRELSALQAPQVNVQVIDLYPASGERSTGAATEAPALGAEGERVTVILNPGGELHGEAFTVEVLGEDGRRLWAGSDLSPNRYGSFTLLLPRRLLAAGARTIRLYGLAQGRQELLYDYALPAAER